MTFAPQSLTDLAVYWKAQGGVPLGIVGNSKHCGGYHLGRDRIFSDCACRPDGVCQPGAFGNDYSVQTKRDRAGLTNAASAIDLGRLEGTYVNLRRFSRWLVAAAQADPTKYRDLREVIYSPDGVTVQRYSGIDGAIHTGPGNGDLSHLTHTHLSFFRDSAGRDKRPLFAGYFADLPDSSTGDAMQSFTVPESRTLATLPKGAKLYPASDLSGTPVILDPGRALVYVGTVGTVKIVAYEPPAGDANSTSVAMFVDASVITGYATVAPEDGVSQADVTAAVAAERKRWTDWKATAPA